MSGRDVAVCVCIGGTVTAGFYMSMTRALLADTLSADGRIREQIIEGSGVNVSTARNRLTQKFLDSGAEWAWMLDADMVFREDTLADLLAVADAEERPFVGALCYGIKDNGVFSTTYSWNGKVPVQRDLIPGFGVVRVGATGVACAVIHRDVFTKTRDHGSANFPWFRETESADGLYAGEDIEFMHRCRAAGVPVHVNTSVDIGHEKRWIADSKAWLSQALEE